MDSTNGLYPGTAPMDKRCWHEWKRPRDAGMNVLTLFLASVWRYHHAFVREDQAFEPRMVLAAEDLAITQIRAQLAEKKRQNEEREPPPPVDHPPVNNNFPT
ncbi:hypothetical protein K457DRAFT_25810 [Linnemannia elongata AG-77]|uniref:Uncharacterized protein n=1 Tax=Linnemannia elongata AG-77 TaxID=1314771 RepID=A0A197JE57_9FUNG|nr:hypothetical protein K457DRAFT_25810 [Linnemannia elongata AG-77]